MSYGFIFGAAGTGKTSYIYQTLTEEALKYPERKYYLFVPEQNTLKAQQELIRLSSRHGLLNLDVLSFQLLAYRVMEELGVRKPDLLDEMTKSMLLRAVVRKTEERLLIYGKKIDKPGFITQLKSAVSEFYQYDLTVEKLKILSERTGDRLLSAKLSDLSLIFDAFQEIRGKRAASAEEIPQLLLHLLPKSELMKDAVLVFDGYTGFTPVQLGIISMLMPQAASLSFSVTIPADASPYKRDCSVQGAADLFWLSRETVAKISELGEKNGLSRKREIVFEKPYTAPRAEVNLLRDPKEEARWLAEQILRLRDTGKTENMGNTGHAGNAGDVFDPGTEKSGFRYREIAVAVSELSSYQEILKEAFTGAGIPYFMDDKADGRESVFAELVAALLDLIEEGYSYDTVIRYLRNPLIQTDREETDLFDNYLRGCGIRSRRALSEEFSRLPKTMEYIDLVRLNAFRTEMLGPVFELHDRLMRGDRTTADRIAALREYLEKAGIDGRMEAFLRMLSEAGAAGLSETGFQTEAEANRRLYELSLSLFDRLESLLGDEKLPFREFAAVLSAGFAELKAGLVPEVMDRVVIGDLKRSRFDDISALFILGANDGLLPSVVSGGGIFTDLEREEILREGVAELAPPDRIDSCIQRFYLYLATHKPRRLLSFSYCKNDMQGKSLKPSSMLFDLKAEYAAAGKELPFKEAEAGGIFSREDALSFLADAFSDGQYEAKRTRTVYNYLRREGFEQETRRLLSASLYSHRAEQLSGEDARALYGDTLYGSVTRLEQYARCPFAHFLRYGLRLSERQQYDIAAMDIGNLYHGAIDLAFREIRANGKELTALSEEEVEALSGRCVDQITGEYNNQVMQSSARNRYLCGRVRRITGRTLKALRAQMKKGDFRLYGCELPFRFDEDGISLHGRIDRVDTCETESKLYVKVIDYKSGRTKFDLSCVFEGLQLQLVTYMRIALKEARSRLAAAEKKPVAPAGMFYYHIEDPVTDYEKGADEAAVEEKLLRELRMNGLVSDDREALLHLDHELFEPGSRESGVIPVKLKDGAVQERGSKTASEEMLSYLSRFASDKLKGMAAEIRGGEIAARPYRRAAMTGCDYCPYHSVCGFDRRIPGCSYRNIKTITKEEAFTALSERYQNELDD